MKIRHLLNAALLSLALGGFTPACAQEAVVGVKNPDALFTSANPKLNRNKQAAYHIVKDLLEAGRWNEADRWISPEYIQHNPLVPSGRDTVVNFFTKVMKVQPQPVPAKMKTPIVAVLAEGDLVTVVYPRPLKDPKDPSKSYTTTWFDTWRFKDGKATEHWDPATKDMMPPN